MNPTREHLNRLFVYNAGTGELFWKRSGRGRNNKQQAGTVVKGSNTYYRQVCLGGIIYLVHRQSGRHSVPVGRGQSYRAKEPRSYQDNRHRT